MKHLTSSLVFLLIFSGICGCAHYRLGDPQRELLHEQPTIWIVPVLLNDVVADAAIALNRELRERAIRDASLKLVESEANADYVLRVTIEKRSRKSLARRSNDTGLSDVLSLDIVCSYELDKSNGDVVKKGEVESDGQVFRSAGFNESARQRVPSMLRDLADDILQDAFLDW